MQEVWHLELGDGAEDELDLAHMGLHAQPQGLGRNHTHVHLQRARKLESAPENKAKGVWKKEARDRQIGGPCGCMKGVQRCIRHYSQKQKDKS